jgi:hypothetical protein
MKNRDSAHPGRIKLTPVDEANGIYDLTRADEPREPGTPLNKKLLDFAVAACGVAAGTSTAYTLNDEFGGFELVNGAKVNFQLHVASGVNPTLNVNGTGAKAIKDARGVSLPTGVPGGSWITASYSAVTDCYCLEGGAGIKQVIALERLTTAAASITIPVPGGISHFHADIQSHYAVTATDLNVTLDGVISGGAGYTNTISLNNATPSSSFNRNNANDICTGGRHSEYLHSLIDISIVNGYATGAVLATSADSTTRVAVSLGTGFVVPDTGFNLVYNPRHMDAGAIVFAEVTY